MENPTTHAIEVLARARATRYRGRFLHVFRFVSGCVEGADSAAPLLGSPTGIRGAFRYTWGFVLFAVAEGWLYRFSGGRDRPELDRDGRGLPFQSGVVQESP